MPVLINASAELLSPKPESELLLMIEEAARTCYQSEHKVKPGSALEIFEKLKARKHESQFEHVSISARLITDRGVTHELVRHRIGVAYSQESTRYCNYSQERFGRQIKVIRPVGVDSTMELAWFTSMVEAEQAYLKLLDLGATPQVARSVLPNSLATNIVVTANLREWYHIFDMRLGPAAHPDMRHVMEITRGLMQKEYPVLFGNYPVQ